MGSIKCLAKKLFCALEKDTFACQYVSFCMSLAYLEATIQKVDILHILHFYEIFLLCGRNYVSVVKGGKGKGETGRGYVEGWRRRRRGKRHSFVG